MLLLRCARQFCLRYLRGGTLAGVPLFLLAIAATSTRLQPINAAAESIIDITWVQVAEPIKPLLETHGLRRENFDAQVADLRQRNQARVKEGDRDHLVYYALQSTAFTKLAPIEPALSAREYLSIGRVPAAARTRLDAFASAARSRRDYGPRMAIFREMLAGDSITLMSEYERAMKSAAPVGAEYQARGLSTDTSVEAGYAMYLALGALRRLEPDRQIRSVLIVGPGFDLAPRTGFVETDEPQSYQPFIVMDALLSTGLSKRDTLAVTAADINPRVARWIGSARASPPRLNLVASVEESSRVRITEDYREYFSAIGGAIGQSRPTRDFGPARRSKSVLVTHETAEHLDAQVIDITTQHLDTRYDLIIATNVFPYLRDSDLLLALSNVASMLSPAGIFIHNEPRPLVARVLLALEMPLLHSRSAVIASVEGGGSPFYDTVWMHRIR